MLKYIECDYMVVEQTEEDFYYSKNEKISKEQNIPKGEFYHYDTPCTIENQIKMLELARFEEVNMVWRKENTTIIVADKIPVRCAHPLILRGRLESQTLSHILCIGEVRLKNLLKGLKDVKRA